MEKFDANDLTILILYRGDTLQRMENLLLVVDALVAAFSTNIFVREAAPYNNGILEKCLAGKAEYEFVEDDTPVLFKTRHFNEMLRNVATQFASIWDTDAMAYDEAIMDSIGCLRLGDTRLALPYNGVYLDTTDILRKRYIATRDFGVFHRNMQKMSRLQQHVMVGGAVLFDKAAFLSLGGENEAYYGWGDDDFDRYLRFMNAGMRIHRSGQVLFHLSHPRGDNSGFNNTLHEMRSKAELSKTRRGL